MFPDGLTMMPDGNESLDFRDSGESVISASPICPNSCRRSVGVGGVTVVIGAGIDVCGGVVGVGVDGSRDLSSVRSVRIGGGGNGGGSSTNFPFRPDKLALLLLLLFPKKLSPFLLPFDLIDPLSEPLLLLLGSFFSWFVPNASFRRRPGETLLFLPLRSGISNVGAGCVAGLGNSVSGLYSATSALGPLVADSPSAGGPLASLASADVECIRGDDEV